MNSPYKLTNGAFKLMFDGNTELKPTVQVIDLRLIRTQNSDAGIGTGGVKNERYRLMLSDGLIHKPGMLASQYNDLVRSQQLQIGSVVQLNLYQASSINGRDIIVVLQLDLLHEKCDIIGEPPAARSAAPMQSINQPVTANNPQTFVGATLAASVPQPNISANSPIYPPQQAHSAGLRPCGNPPSNMPYESSMHSRPEPASAMSGPPANSYARSVQPASIYMNRGPTAKNEQQPKIIPIAALNPYQGRWSIKARVTSKSPLRHYHNAKGDGKVCSFDLLDSSGGEIRITCFNDVADQFYDQIESGKVYIISKGTLKPASKAYNHLKNDHEIILDRTSTIQPCFDDDDDGLIPKQQFHFQSIAVIEGLDNNTVLDIIGVVFRVFPSATIKRKNDTETLKRTLHLKDDSGRSVELTLWGNFCTDEGSKLQNFCDSGVFPVLAVKAARVSDFNGKTVGTITTSQLYIEPDYPEARKLREWFDKVGRNTPSVSLSRDSMSITRKVISQIKDEQLGTNQKPDWITVGATIWHMRVENFCYTACPLMRNEQQCSKKVTNNGDGKWRCDTCDQTVDQCDYRYILGLQIQDHTGLIWVTAFQEAGKEIMGISAKDLYCIKYEEQDEEKFAEIVRNVLHTKYNFKLKVKEETYNDEQQVKSTIVKADKIEFLSETSFFLDLIKKDGANSVGPKSETSVVPFSINMGSGSGVSQQGALPAIQMGQFASNGSNGLSGVNSSGRISNVGSGSGVTQQAALPANQMGQFGSNGSNGLSVVNSLGRISNGGPSGGGNAGPQNNCYRCNRPGHWARDCPGVKSEA
ncbi:replication protein A 70 kDa DNA-binding subunit A-like [Rutidosis leptorrhynchoides]|uniref:replication protein A 70 kDa DNA-binding subunit A-like n=1 Tax=Rutidosis leptorrhynchoides TaxID=125765 RepID=UPI003A998D09